MAERSDVNLMNLMGGIVYDKTRMRVCSDQSRQAPPVVFDHFSQALAVIAEILP